VHGRITTTDVLVLSQDECIYRLRTHRKQACIPFLSSPNPKPEADGLGLSLELRPELREKKLSIARLCFNTEVKCLGPLGLDEKGHVTLKTTPL
jgi:hypothetical protein